MYMFVYVSTCESVDRSCVNLVSRTITMEVTGQTIHWFEMSP